MAAEPPVRDESYQSAPGIEPLMSHFVLEHKMRNDKRRPAAPAAFFHFFFYCQTIKTCYLASAWSLGCQISIVGGERGWSGESHRFGLAAGLFRTFRRGGRGRGRGVFPLVVLLLLAELMRHLTLGYIPCGGPRWYCT